MKTPKMEELFAKLTSAIDDVLSTRVRIKGRHRFTTSDKRVLRGEFLKLREAADAAISELDKRDKKERVKKEFVKAQEELFQTPDEETKRLIEKVTALLNEKIADSTICMPLATVSTPVANHESVLCFGRGWRGDPGELVKVPVTMVPVMHQSLGGKWSWRTTVAGHTDFRHINVSNFHSAVRQNDGTLYVYVNSTWRTDQPVFKDYCNRDPILRNIAATRGGTWMDNSFRPDDPTNEDIDIMAEFNADVGDR